METLLVKKLCLSATVPTRATSGSAGYDLYSSADYEMLPQQVTMVSTGIAIAINQNNCVGLVYARSGLSCKNLIAPINCVGVIDSDYRGEIIIPLFNHGTEVYLCHKNDRIAQLVIAPIFTPNLVLTDKLDETARGENGFGSTD